MSQAARLEALLRELAGRPGIPHVVMAVERVDGSFRWAGAAGEADGAGTPMQVETPFMVASVDKLFTATAVLKLHEQDRVRLDEPIAGYLGSALPAGLHRVRGEDYTGRLTARHLLGHTSGLACYLEDRPKGGMSLIDRLEQQGDQAWTLADALAHVGVRLRPHFAPPPPGAARQKVRYCDTNFRLLLALIETVTGEPMQDALARLVFEPAGMRRTWMPGRSHPAEPAPTPAALWFGARRMEIPQAYASVPVVIAPVGDLLRFMRALIGLRLFERPETLALMFARFNRFGVPRDRASLRAPSWPIEYGLGLMRFQLPRIFTGFRRLPPVYGHSGSTGTWLFHCPALDLLLAGGVDQGTAGPVPYRLIPKILSIVADGCQPAALSREEAHARTDGP